ncbi:MAG: bifunctional hydroxymethylpyrimidine kinase/phosphomethylpyrimidine kinase [Actinomycetota bacterium]|nr:bifunctional hydroxymethylpyrimidine kinase/phosphomethylpyrimidine kinase [Actinomycetota bacterium]
MTPPVALTIAGSDSGGGAGIQADLLTFAAFGVHGTTAITALTAQNTVGVQGIHAVPAAFVDAQIGALLSDLVPQAAKTGMLATAEVIEVVAERAAAGDLPNLVVDPVMVAASGDRLLDPDAEQAYAQLLFPHAAVITPNLREAGVLVSRELRSLEDMEEAARELAETGAGHVVVKGGHLDAGQDAVDVLFDGARVTHLRAPRVETHNVHGTGCTFASAIAAGLALGLEPLEAMRGAKEYLTGALYGSAGWKLGAGRGPVDHLGRLSQVGQVGREQQ